MGQVTTSCPSCGKGVRSVWPSCRACGALLMAAPAPLAKVGAQNGTRTGAAPAAARPTEERFFPRPVLQPPVAVAPPAQAIPYTHNPRMADTGFVADTGAGKWVMLIGTVVFVI